MPLTYTDGSTPCPNCGQREWKHNNWYSSAKQRVMTCSACGTDALYQPRHDDADTPSPIWRFAPPKESDHR